MNAIPIINENDTVVTDEIRFGDNDTLAGLVANLIQADMLVIMADQKACFRLTLVWTQMQNLFPKRARMMNELFLWRLLLVEH